MTDINTVREALEAIREAARVLSDLPSTNQVGTRTRAAWDRLNKAGDALSRLEAAAVPALSREDVGRFAKEAGLLPGDWPYEAPSPLQRFASLVRSVPVGEVKPGVWPDSVSDTVLQTPEPDRWLDAEPRPVPMFHMATLMQYGERCAEAGMSAATRAVKPAHEVGEVKPVAWLYTLFGRSGEVANREASVVNWDERYQPFGRPGIDFHKEGIVRKEPLYTTPPAPPEGTVTLELAMMLKQCIYRLRKYGHPDIADRGLALLQRHDLVGSPLRDEFEPSSHAAATISDTPAAPQPGDKL